jgi:hypothetical protein
MEMRVQHDLPATPVDDANLRLEGAGAPLVYVSGIDFTGRLLYAQPSGSQRGQGASSAVGRSTA